jgi:alkanesulfonate monooxygenase SsuD/methylene tetrahydromethanopterin reductase-like flavin-dependent oxidoreductase (luciferase family)
VLTFGVVTGQHQLSWDEILDQWHQAEELGFDSAWLFDHFTALYGDPAGPCLEASTLLAALARETSRLRIGVLVYGNTHRHPAILAKEIVTIDHVSGGRAILGTGTGWNVTEHQAFGLPLPAPGERVAMLDESLDVIELLLTGQRASYDGEHYQLHDALGTPTPVQDHLPILVGGKRPKMLRVIAKHADIWDSSDTPEEHRARSEVLKQACEEVGRDDATITHSISLGADQLTDFDGFEALARAYYAAGVRQMLFDYPIDPEGQRVAARVATELLPRLRDLE